MQFYCVPCCRNDFFLLLIEDNKNLTGLRTIKSRLFGNELSLSLFMRRNVDWGVFTKVPLMALSHGHHN